MGTFALACSILQYAVPCLQDGGRGERGLDRLSSFLFGALYFSLSSFPLTVLDEQELTKNLKSPREDEQLYAAQVRSGKREGG